MKQPIFVFTALFLALCLAPLPLQAAEVDADGANTPDRQDVIRILQLSGELDNVRLIVRKMHAMAKERYSEANPDRAERVAEIVQQEMQAELNSALPKLADMMAEAWLPHLTQRDVNVLLQFYSSPTWTKLRGKRQEISQEGMILARGWANAFAQQADQRIQNRLQEEGLAP
ncbi:DUF2059 domain-containing protein [Desulfovibrio oxyclinae]|uniref:DUF2059 domain-containing protein n=1 Tax=Desulfovibrio oxyclinae TaxID=63560 RepID=UPI00035ED422|nr:DUF2059 domain-containing protein [Desulfovibrio oxyclinae]